MKQVLLMIAVVMGQSVLAADKKPLTGEGLARDAKVIEAEIRIELEKPKGELTKAVRTQARCLFLALMPWRLLVNP